MIPVIPSDKPLTPAEKMKAYQDQRDSAAMKIVSDRMDRILHGGDKNHGTADVEYDLFAR